MIFLFSILSLFFFCQCDGLIIYGLSGAGLPDVVRVNSYAARSQGTSTNQNAYLRNYTLVFSFGDMFGCTSSLIPQLTRSQALWEIGFPYSCPQSQQLSIAKSKGASVVLSASVAPIAAATFFEMGVSDIVFAPPIVYPGLYPDDNQWFSKSIFVPFLFPSYPNVTIYLEYPDRNPVFQATFDIWGSFSIISGVSLGICIMALCVAFAKLGNFLVIGNISTWSSLPVLALSLSIAGLVLATVECYSSIGCIGSVPHPADGVVFENYPWAFAFTIGILCGFYFKEVTLLTTVRTRMYTFFFWPLLIIVVTMWCVFIIVPAIDIAGVAYRDSYYQFVPGSPLQIPQASKLPFLQFWISMVLISLACMNFILIWGVASIIYHHNDLKSHKGTVIRLSILAVLACIFADVFAPLWFLGRFFGGTPQVFPDVTQLQWATIINVADSFGPPLTIFCFVLMFEVTVHKEIEVSKSATSSTFGVSPTKEGEKEPEQLGNVIEL